MTNHMILSLCLTALACNLTACSDDQNPVLTQRDWEGTDTYFKTSDPMSFDIYYRPYNAFVADVMPMYDPVAGNFKIMYLQDYHPNRTGTYHPFWAVETSDGSSYRSLGEMIPTGEIAEQDAALGTGCTVWSPEDKLYYTYYTGHAYNPSASAETVMRATSPDFKTWTKDLTFMLRPSTDGYSKADFRDPCVFKDDSGLWNMVVTTRLNGKGVLARYTSADLKNWKHRGVFMTAMWDRFYECPDVFRMGEYWYMVYSEIHSAIRKVQYFKGRTLDELAASTADDAGRWPDDHEGFLDSRGMYAAKTASDGTDRYIWGWCATREGQDNSSSLQWGGNMVAHRLVQHQDGSLTIGEVPAIAALYTGAKPLPEVRLEAGGSKLMPRLGRRSRIELTVTCAGRFGISLARGTDSDRYYTLVINPEGSDRRKINLEEEGPAGKGFLADNDGYVFNAPADNVYHIVLTTDNSVLTMYVNDCAGYTTRLYNTALNPWSVNAYDSQLSAHNISVSTADKR